MASSLTNNDLLAPFAAAKPQKWLGPDFPDGLIVNVLDSQYKIIENQTIQLKGARGPLSEFTYEIEQRMRRDNYVGRNEPNIQVFGYSEKPLVIQCQWTDSNVYPEESTISARNSVNVSAGFVNFFEALVKSGNLVLLTYADRYLDSENRFEYVRYAILKNFKPSMHFVSWFDIELTFEILTDQPPFYDFFSAVPASNDVLSGGLQLAAIATSLEATPDQFPGASPEIISQLKGLINDVNAGIATVTRAIETLGNYAQDLSNSVNQFIGIIDGAIGTVVKFKQDVTALYTTIANIPDETASITSQAAAIASVGIIDRPAEYPAGNATANVAPYFSEQNNQQSVQQQSLPAQSTQQILMATKKKFISSVKSSKTLTYTVISGDTLPKVAHKVYGDFSLWPRILRYNHLTTTIITTGQKLIIPRVSQ